MFAWACQLVINLPQQILPTSNNSIFQSTAFQSVSMDSSISNSPTSISSSASLSIPRFRCFDPANFHPPTTNHRFLRSFSSPRLNSTSPTINGNGGAGISTNSEPKIVTGEAGFELEDVPHLTDYIPELPVKFFSFSDPQAVFGCFANYYILIKRLKRKQREFNFTEQNDYFDFLLFPSFRAFNR